MAIEFKKLNFDRNTSSDSNIINIIEDVREKICIINNITYDFCKKYENEFFLLEGEIPKILNKINKLHLITDNDLKNPKLVISSLGTTKAGKSTFLNSLLGMELAPMDVKELTAGTTKFIFNNTLNGKAKLTINYSDQDNLQDENYIENTFELEYKDCYDKSKEIMETYRSKSKYESLPVPSLLIETDFLIGKERGFSGLESNINIEIVDLPGIKNIHDSSNLKVIQDNLKSSIVVLLINYTELHNDRDNLYKELYEIKESIGSVVNIIFLLNKVNLKTDNDGKLEEIIEECKIEIQEKLNLIEKPDIIPINSLLLFYLQKIFFAYIKGDLLDYDEERDNLKDNDYIKIIKDSFKSLFNSLSPTIMDKIDYETDDLATNIKKKIKFKDKIPSYSDFYIFWKKGLENTGALPLDIDINLNDYDKGGGLVLFQVIKNRVEQNIKELILFPAIKDLSKEYSNFYNLLENTINISKLKDIEELNKAKENLDNINKILSVEIDEIEASFRNVVKNVLPDIRSNDTTKRRQALLQLELEEDSIQLTINNVIRNVEINTIQIINSSLSKQDSTLDFLSKLQDKWKPEITKEIEKPYETIKSKLYNEIVHINSGRIFDYLDSDKETKDRVEEINNNFSFFRDNIQASISEITKLEMQKNISNLSNLLNSWLKNKNLATEEKLNSYINELNSSLILPTINLPEVDYTFEKKDILDNKIKSNTSIEKIYQRTEKRTRKKTVSYWIFWEKEIDETYDFKVYKEENRFKINYPPVRELSRIWSNDLNRMKETLWNSFCDVLITLLNLSLESYKDLVNSLTEQVSKMISLKEYELLEKKDSQEKMWENISISNKNILEYIKEVEFLIKGGKN